MKAGLKVILCVGEMKAEREAGYTDALVEYQTLIALTGLTGEQVADVVIAYEPVWAIGTGLTATDEQANETIGVIRKAVARKYGQEVADKTRIQYGGSMNPKNVKGPDGAARDRWRSDWRCLPEGSGFLPGCQLRQVSALSERTCWKLIFRRVLLYKQVFSLHDDELGWIFGRSHGMVDVVVSHDRIPVWQHELLQPSESLKREGMRYEK